MKKRFSPLPLWDWEQEKWILLSESEYYDYIRKFMNNRGEHT